MANEKQSYYAEKVETVLSHFKANFKSGLDSEEIQKRLQQYGLNELEVGAKRHWYQVLASQFTDVLVIILMVAAIISVVVGKPGDAIAIIAIIFLNGVLGFIQEWRAEKAIEALQRMLSPRCRVVRSGHEREIDAKELVPGDIVVLEIGDHVPADLRLIETINLQIDESALTGESVSVRKEHFPVAVNAPLSARTSMAWMGTAVTNGRAKGIVVATGMQTEFGRIAELTQSVSRDETPLQRKLAVLGKQLGIFSIGISFLVAVAGFLLGKAPLEMFFTGVSLAVAVVPEGLPIVVTITMALGVRVMVRKRALLRRLRAAEVLGSATVICTDKTGTLTRNEMTVTRIWLPAGEIQTTGIGYDPKGHFETDGHKIDYHTRIDLLALLNAGLLCSHARLFKDDIGWHQLGDPTEAALIVAAYKAWISPDGHASAISEFSFDSTRKRMTVIRPYEDEMIAYVKGAPEVILEKCTRVFDGNSERPITNDDRKAFIDAYTEMAKGGLRTLALAHRHLSGDDSMKVDEVEGGLTLLGVVGIMDPPRKEVAEALKIAQGAGIHTLMITGDASETAISIANQIGMKVRRAISGSELSEMNDEELKKILGENVVFARTTPEHKLRIVQLLQRQGHVVAMTGDGVNDAPALKKADIGIAMGIRGTDVSKAASDMILTDDNFASIIGAVKEGRRQYENIQKFVRYLLSSNMGEVIAIFFNILLRGPLILLPVQILWMNLITDGVTAVALGVEPTEKDIMRRKPRSAKEPILNRFGILMIFILGGYIGFTTLWLFHHYLQAGKSIILAQTVAFTGIIIIEKMNVLNFRALRQPLAVIGFFSNPWILISIVLNIGLQACAVYLPFMQHLLHTVPLGLKDWGLIVLVALPIFLITEFVKIIRWKFYSV